jgi:hypothetical protein
MYSVPIDSHLFVTTIVMQNVKDGITNPTIEESAQHDHEEDFCVTVDDGENDALV